jgi:hypothetical protein
VIVLVLDSSRKALWDFPQAAEFELLQRKLPRYFLALFESCGAFAEFVA